MVVFLLPFFWIPIVSKIFVPAMRKFWLMSCFYWAPVSLCPTSNLDRISKKTIHITTVETLDFLDDIKIVEKLPIKYDILRPLHSWYPIEGECYRMIDRDTDIEDKSWEYHPEDKWHSDNLTYIHHGKWEFPFWKFHALIPSSHLFDEYDPLFFKGESIFLRKTIIFFFKIIIQGFDFCQDIFDSRFHK